MTTLSQNGVYESARSFRGAGMQTQMSMGLWNQKQFRAYREFTANTVIKIVAAKPFVLKSQTLWTGSGAVRLAVVAGATEGGTFTALSTKFCLNTLSGDVAGSTVVTVGGTITGGTEREVIRADSGTAQGSASGSTGTAAGVRVLAAGTYYLSFVCTGTTVALYNLEWEEMD